MVAMKGFAPTAVLCALLTPLAWADARDSYRRGLEAIERGDWTQAAEQMRGAIAEKAQESSGTFRRYLPHYYLGLALFELGDCAAAADAWEESVRQGVVSREREMSSIRQKRQICAERALESARRARSAREEEMSARLREQIERAAKVAAKVNALRSRPELAGFWEEGQPSRQDELGEANRLIDNARQVAADRSGAQDADLWKRAESWAVAARQRMESLRQEATAIVPESEDAVDEARAILDSIRPLEPLEGDLAAAASAVRDLLAVADRSGESPEPAGSSATIEGLEDVLADLREAAAFPPDRLLEAARAFIAGDYSRVLDDLVEAAPDDERERAHTHLLLAASRFALYVIGERSDDSLRELARSDALAVGASEPGLQPSPEVFSPSFVEFFDQIGK